MAFQHVIKKEDAAKFCDILQHYEKTIPKFYIMPGFPPMPG